MLIKNWNGALEWKPFENNYLGFLAYLLQIRYNDMMEYYITYFRYFSDILKLGIMVIGYPEKIFYIVVEDNILIYK